MTVGTAEENPKIGVVIIGVNVEKHIGDCIRSVQLAEYPQELLEIVYVDGGSMDQSVQVAKGFNATKVLELKDHHPTPGRGRNEGWRLLSAPFIQFLDADTILDPLWLKKALPYIDHQTIAVCGSRKERFPAKNIFHILVDMEWRYEMGPCRYFGGDVLIKRDALEKTDGYDESLVAGEDPELSYRIRQHGWQIMRIDTPMTTHDINMLSLKQYMKRAYRSGHAYAEIGLRFIKNKDKLWMRELFRIPIKSMLPVLLILFGIMIGKVLFGILLALFILFRPLFFVGRLKRQFGRPWLHTFCYLLHSALVIYPQFFGMLRYALGKISGNTLKNTGIKT